MSLNRAIKFVKLVRTNRNFRMKCNNFATKKELLDDLGFNENEFEDALNMQLVKCQTYDEAEHYQQMRMWFALL